MISTTSAGLPISHLNAFHQEAKTALPSAKPKLINYISADYPYEPCYVENWEQEIKKVRTMSKYGDVHDLMRHIHDTMRDAFKGTKYEQTHLFYHDALISMTNKDCIDWMREEGILKRWILPELGMNDEIIVVDQEGNVKVNTRYSGRPVGNCMELMPLDNSLF